MSCRCGQGVPWAQKLRDSGSVSPAPFRAHPHGARRGQDPVWRQVPGRGSETWCPPARGSACLGREAAWGRPGRTGHDAGGDATSEPRRLRGRPARGRGGGTSQSRSGPAPCRPPQVDAGPGEGAASRVPLPQISHSSNTSCLGLRLGVLQRGKPEPGREALPSTIFDLPSLSTSPATPNTP